MTEQEIIDTIEVRCQEAIDDVFNYGNGQSHVFQEVVQIIDETIEAYPNLFTQAQWRSLQTLLLEKFNLG